VSQENLAVVRRAYDQANERGLVAALADVYDEDAVLHAIDGWPESGPWRGRDAIIDQWRRIEEDFAEQESLIEAIVAHEDWVLVRNLWRVRSRSGIPGEFRNSIAFRMRDGKVVEARFYWDHADALKAVGLEE
jgi:ketosteroid isomerase-like protein